MEHKIICSNPKGHGIFLAKDGRTLMTDMGTAFLTETGAVTRGCGKGPLITYTRETDMLEHYFPCASKETIAKCAYETREATHISETCTDVLKNRKTLLGEWDFRNAPTNDREKALMRNAFDLCAKLKAAYDVKGVEQIVFDLDSQLAATVDCLAKSHTNGDITLFAWSIIPCDAPAARNAIHPVQYLSATTLTLAGVRLAIWEMILKAAAYIPRDRRVVKAVAEISEKKFDIVKIDETFNDAARDMLIAMLEQSPF